MKHESVEDYLQAIFHLEELNESVSTNDLAEEMNVTPASASSMIKRLAQDRIVNYTPYHGATLTQEGRKKALAIIRRHALVEVFLTQVLNVPLDKVDEEAHRLEHSLSDYLEDRIADYLSQPDFCPHGSPIPGKNGSRQSISRTSLSSLKSGDIARVSMLDTNDPALLRYLQEINLVPRQTIEILYHQPEEDFLKVRINEDEYVIGHRISDHINVKKINVNEE